MVMFKMNSIEKQVLENLKDLGLKISDNAVASVRTSSYYAQVEIAVIETDQNSRYFQQPAFASDLHIRFDKNNDGEWDKMRMSLASSGALSPDNKAGFWRVVHTAEILNNWTEVLDMFQTILEENENSLTNS